VRILTLLVALGASACSKPEDPAPPAPEPPEVKAFRQEVDAQLRGARSLTLISCGPIPDGGSYLFEFRTDAGTTLELQAQHQDLPMGGSSGSQAFLLCKRSVDFYLARGSALEERLLDLLETATAADQAALDRLKVSLKRRTPYRSR
jgi:hypothetical protein